MKIKSAQKTIRKPMIYGLIIRAILPNVFLAALVSLAVAAGNDGNSARVSVKDIHGKPAAGAELWLERADAKSSAKKQISDATGQFTFRNLAPGTYKISAYDHKTPAGTATTVRPSADRLTSVTLSLGKMSRPATANAKTKKRYVWVAAETGTHIGGGKWVPVEDDVGGTGASTVEKRSGSIFNPVTNPQIRGWSGPPGR